LLGRCSKLRCGKAVGTVGSGDPGDEDNGVLGEREGSSRFCEVEQIGVLRPDLQERFYGRVRLRGES